MRKKPKQKKSNRRKFLKYGFSIGAGTIAGSEMLTSCNAKEPDGERMKVLLPDGKLAEIDKDAIHTHTHQVSNEEARKGDPNKEYVMVIDLAKCRNARKCVDSCQSMHHLPPEDEWIKVF